MLPGFCVVGWVYRGLVHEGLRNILLTTAAVCGGAQGHYEISENRTLKSVLVSGIPQSPTSNLSYPLLFFKTHTPLHSPGSVKNATMELCS